MTQALTDSDRRIPRHAVILCHPAEESFNASVARTYCETVRELGQEAVLRDLYRIGFDPVLNADERPTVKEPVQRRDVAAEIESISGADIFVLIYPIWFGTPPAMMKGYVERVLGAGFSDQDVRARHAHPLLRGKRLLSITTSGSTIQWLHLQGAWMPLRSVFDSYIANAFSMASTEHVHLESIAENMTEAHAREKLLRVEQLARVTCAGLTDAGVVGSANFERAGSSKA